MISVSESFADGLEEMFFTSRANWWGEGGTPPSNAGGRDELAKPVEAEDLPGGTGGGRSMIGRGLVFCWRGELVDLVLLI